MSNLSPKRKITIIITTFLCLVGLIGGLTTYAADSGSISNRRMGGFRSFFSSFFNWGNDEDDYSGSSLGPANSYWDTSHIIPCNPNNSGNDVQIDDSNIAETPVVTPVTEAPETPVVSDLPAVSSVPTTTSKPSNNNTDSSSSAEAGKVYDGPGKESSAFYKPGVNANMDYNNSSSKYCFSRSRESDHFYVFWEPGFGSDPNASSVPSNLRVDVDDLLTKAEQYYSVNVNKFHMPDNVLLNGYKMQIYLIYQEEWLATGAGYDETIGAIWVNPSTCQPVGSTIAHEIGHTFQYMVASKHLAEGKSSIGETGFRYGYPGSNGGCSFWEVSAQYQAYSIYPAESFTWHHMDTWLANYNRAVEHESMRYQSYWWLFFAEDKHDSDVLQRIWNESKYPEDALSTYMRIYMDNDLNKFYDSMYEYASKSTTFDFDAVRQYSDNYQGKYETTLYPMGDGYSQVSYDDCPEANGFNAIKLDPAGGSKVTVAFKGLNAGSNLSGSDPNGAGKYNSYSGTNGWRYGFVALLNDGTRVYSDSYADKQNTISFDIPNNTQYVYFVVLGAPSEYVCHAWDDNNSNDVQMPYAVKISYQ